MTDDAFQIISQNPILDGIRKMLIDAERDELVRIVNATAVSQPSLASIAEKVIDDGTPEMKEPLSWFYYGVINIKEYNELVKRKAKSDRTLAERAKINFPNLDYVRELAEEFIPLREEFYLNVGRNLVQIARREDMGTRQAASDYFLEAIRGAFSDKESMQRYFNLEVRAHQYVLEVAGCLLNIHQKMNELGISNKFQKTMPPGSFVAPTPEAMVALKEAYTTYKSAQFRELDLLAPTN